ncbi:MAG: MarC family protein [Parachlamydiaceae bacterium]
MSLFQIALTFFLVTNPIGNSPTVLALVKNYDFDKQKRILIREGVISFVIAIFFQYLGEKFLGLLHVSDFAMTLCGGILLLVIALGMIFPKSEVNTQQMPKQEPFIVPIAIPLLSGPGVLTMIMLLARQEANDLKISIAIFLAWAGVIGVMTAAPYMQRVLGKRGLTALEQLMGMILSMISMAMIVSGVSLFLKTLG